MKINNQPSSIPPEASADMLSYEEALAQLEEIITRLDQGNQTLDQSLTFYERGQALARRCSFLLEQAELKIKQFSGEDLEDFEPQS